METGPRENPVENWLLVLHRDIKPENVFLKTPDNPEDYPEPVLADWDLCHELEPDDAPFNSGTMIYLAPVSGTRRAYTLAKC